MVIHEVFLVCVNREVIERNVSLKFVCKYLERTLAENETPKADAAAKTKSRADRFSLENRFPLSLTGSAINWINKQEASLAKKS